MATDDEKIEPDLIDYFEDDEMKNIDCVRFIIDSQNYEAGEKRKAPTLEEKKRRPYVERKTHARRDPKSTHWWLDYVVDAERTWRDPGHRNGKLFKRRFCLSFVSVHELVQKIREPEHSFWRESKDAVGRSSSPIHLLVLGSLRILTRNVTLDDLFEETYISAEVHRTFFKLFMKWYATTVFPAVVRMPKLHELHANGIEFEAAGFPGCVCSVDCVHVRVWGVSANLKQVSTGKEKFPSRVFEVSVNHRGMILSATKGFYGSVMDRSIMRFDGAMVDMYNGCYKDYKFSIYDENGVLKEVSGAYAICDKEVL